MLIGRTVYIYNIYKFDLYIYICEYYIQFVTEPPVIARDGCAGPRAECCSSRQSKDLFSNGALSLAHHRNVGAATPLVRCAPLRGTNIVPVPCHAIHVRQTCIFSCVNCVVSAHEYISDMKIIIYIYIYTYIYIYIYLSVYIYIYLHIYIYLKYTDSIFFKNYNMFLYPMCKTTSFL